MNITKRRLLALIIVIIILAGISIYLFAYFSKDTNAPVKVNKPSSTTAATSAIKPGDKVNINEEVKNPPKVKPAEIPAPGNETEIKGTIITTAKDQYSIRDSKDKNQVVALELTDYKGDVTSYLKSSSVTVRGTMKSQETNTGLQIKLKVSSIDVN